MTVGPRHTLLPILTVLLALTAMAQSWAPSPQFQVTSDLAAALRVKDVAKAFALFADRAVLLPPSGETVSGRIEIEAYIKERVERGALVLAIVSTGSSAAEGLGFDSGTCEFTVTPVSGEKKKGRGTYVALFRQSDGKWKIDRLTWNSTWLPTPDASGAQTSPNQLPRPGPVPTPKPKP